MKCGSPATTFSRRRFVHAVSASAFTGIAGCTGGGRGAGEEGEPGAPTAGSSPERTTSDGATTSDPSDRSGTGSEGTTTASDLGLQEANVVGVEVESRDGAHRFSVTLYHDDDGEDGYADRWQVETVEGDLLGRRELLHAHGTEPFTRSETVEVPTDVTCVVVRGHDQTHGGQAMLVNVETGATREVRQGADRRQVDPDDCP